MPRRISCEASLIRCDGQRDVLVPGLVVVGSDDKKYIDPQIEHGYHTSFGPSQDPTKWLALSETDPPELEDKRGHAIVRRLSLPPSVLNFPTHAQQRRFRVSADTTTAPTSTHALVGIVKYNEWEKSRAYRGISSDVVLLGHQEERRGRSRGPAVDLLLLPPGALVRFLKHHRDPLYEPTMLEAINDPEKGLIIKRAAVRSLRQTVASS